MPRETGQGQTLEGHHDILGGIAHIYQVKQSGDVWQMRCWIHAEKKYIKKSLRTKDLDSAKTKGRELYYTMMVKVSAGQKNYSPLLQKS